MAFCAFYVSTAGAIYAPRRLGWKQGYAGPQYEEGIAHGHQKDETVPGRRKKPHADTRMGKSVSEWVNIVNLLQDYATLFPPSQNVDRRDCFCRYFDSSVPLLGTEATPGLARNEGESCPE